MISRKLAGVARSALMLVLLGVLSLLPVQAAKTAAVPFDWRVDSPASQGFSKEKLVALRQQLAAQRTKAFLVIRNDTIVYEWYSDDHGPDKKHGTASLAKALVAGVSTAVAMGDGRIALDDVAAKFVPQWREDARKSRITVRQLGSHTSGLADAEADGLPHEQLTGWAGDFWKRLPPPRDPFTLSRDATPVLSEPGAKWAYSNPGIAMLTYAVTAALRDAPEKDVRTLLRDRVMRPIGVPDAGWSVGYDATFPVDGLLFVGSWGGGSFTARAAARIGRLMLREGDWDGRRLISAEAVRATTREAATPGPNGIGWWCNTDGFFPNVSRDAFWGAGAGHQVLFVVPSLQLIAVRNGQNLDGPRGTEEPFARQIFEPLIAAITNQAGGVQAEPQPTLLPSSRVIARVEWAPIEAIRRAARGSDNWPLTWADDGALYGAYGDGNGFEPFTPEKLSLGLARIEGMPENFRGENIPARSLEARGDGSKGRKASGLLCVKGVLYLWARNAGNSQLAWSDDHGRTWTWADWKLTNSFGCPTFLNCDRDYGGNRDGFAYVYSPDSDDAYSVADRFVLARVPIDRIREREAYEFFCGLAADSNPSWTSRLELRADVLTRIGSCYRPSVTFNTGLNRFLLVHTRPNERSRDATGKIDVRFHGGLVIYEAPRPWGPWSVVFDADNWDVGPGDSASFPAKWISDDGRTLPLVFSGNDSFSVRQAHVILIP